VVEKWVRPIKNGVKVLLTQFDQELTLAKSIYDNSYQNPPLHKNQPPTAGRLKWANELLRRIQEPRDRFNLVDHPSISSEEAAIIFKKYDQMVELIKKFKVQFYTPPRAPYKRTGDNFLVFLGRAIFF